jgi:hypothetical protein
MTIGINNVGDLLSSQEHHIDGNQFHGTRSATPVFWSFTRDRCTDSWPFDELRVPLREAAHSKPTED